MKQKYILIQDQFSKHHQELRQHFDQRMNDPSSGKRFVWDYWHIPDQYTLLRTPAYHYFPRAQYLKFHRELLTWGRQTLGCWDVSPPWLSCYVDGCKQELHADVPHGPWAWVYSLTPSTKDFQGGETFILKPNTLNYWNHFHKTNDRESESFVDKISPKFNRLIVFDPRFPHGVTEVRGPHDPKQGRLVIHGWFTEPKTYVEGPLPAKACEKVLNQAFDQMMNQVPNFSPSQGVVSIGLDVGSNGQVKKIEFKTNTLIYIGGEIPRDFNKMLLKNYSQLRFPTARSSTKMTIPLIFS